MEEQIVFILDCNDPRSTRDLNIRLAEGFKVKSITAGHVCTTKSVNTEHGYFLLVLEK